MSIVLSLLRLAFLKYHCLSYPVSLIIVLLPSLPYCYCGINHSNTEKGNWCCPEANTAANCSYSSDFTGNIPLLKSSRSMWYDSREDRKNTSGLRRMTVQHTLSAVDNKQSVCLSNFGIVPCKNTLVKFLRGLTVGSCSWLCSKMQHFYLIDNCCLEH